MIAPQVEKIINGDLLIGILVRTETASEGNHFVTSGTAEQQIGIAKLSRGAKIDPHTHIPLERKIYSTSETLVMKQGVMRVDFYGELGQFLESKEIHSGDILTLFAGGHGFEVLDDAEFVEIKQGPYHSAHDKVALKKAGRKTYTPPAPLYALR